MAVAIADDLIRVVAWLRTPGLVDHQVNHIEFSDDLKLDRRERSGNNHRRVWMSGFHHGRGDCDRGSDSNGPGGDNVPGRVGEQTRGVGDDLGQDAKALCAIDGWRPCPDGDVALRFEQGANRLAVKMRRHSSQAVLAWPF